MLVTKDPNRIKSMVSEKRVKLHIFDPSQRKIWTVVGKGKEHWLDPDLNFCSCAGFYFGKKGSGRLCGQRLWCPQAKWIPAVFANGHRTCTGPSAVRSYFERPFSHFSQWPLGPCRLMCLFLSAVQHRFLQ